MRTAAVTHVDPDRNTVMLNVGSVDGARPGDVFRVYDGMRGRWNLWVTDVGERHSGATVERRSYHEDRRRLPDLPDRGAKGGFAPPPDED